MLQQLHSASGLLSSFKCVLPQTQTAMTARAQTAMTAAAMAVSVCNLPEPANVTGGQNVKDRLSPGTQLTRIHGLT
jgi:hypothetical protein